MAGGHRENACRARGAGVRAPRSDAPVGERLRRYKIQGRGDAGQVLLDDALALEAAGAQLLVLECVPVELAKRVTEALTIPVIGIGAGNVTDGQILVMHDAFGITGGHIPKFAKNFLSTAGDMRAAVRQYVAEVESGVYPGEEHSFH
jgi:3-methyl-2-oxobutanoate hydroxymethyltransferase